MDKEACRMYFVHREACHIHVLICMAFLWIKKITFILAADGNGVMLISDYYRSRSLLFSEAGGYRSVRIEHETSALTFDG